MHELNKIKHEFDLKNRRIIELEDINIKLKSENSKLLNKVQEYQQLNKDWELKVTKINAILTDLEEKNNCK
jgi:hypothetical protein